MLPGLDLPYKADPAQPLTTAGEELDNLLYFNPLGGARYRPER